MTAADASRLLKALLGDFWSDPHRRQAILESEGTSPLNDAYVLVRGVEQLDHLPQADDSVESGEIGREHMIALAAAHTLKQLGTWSGFDCWYRELRAHFQRGDFPRALDHLAEGEAGLLHLQLLGASSGQLGGAENPDVSILMERGKESWQHAIECKRIRRTYSESLTSFGLALHEELRPLVKKQGPFALSIWLHRPAKKIKVGSIVAAIAAILKNWKPRDEGSWITTSSSDSEWQISVRAMPEYRNPSTGPIVIDDLPVDASMVASYSFRQGIDGPEEFRAGPAIRIKTSVLENRIGSLEARLNIALSQMPKSATSTSPGSIAVRVKAPAKKHDLFEMDQVVRARLRKNATGEVAFVLLFWDECRRVVGKEDSNGDRLVEIFFERRHHCIRNTIESADPYPHDTFETYFGPLPNVWVRNPIDGSIIGIDKDVVGKLLEPLTTDEERERDKEDATIIVLRLKEPYRAQMTRKINEVWALNGRRYVIHLNSDETAYCVEFLGTEAKHFAVLELFAWRGCREIRFAIATGTEGFAFGATRPSDQKPVCVESVRLRPLRFPRNPSASSRDL